MSEAFLIMARNIFAQKYKELEKARDALKDMKKGDPLPISPQKLKEYETLLAELGNNHRMAEKIITEIRKLSSKAKGKKS